MKKLVLTTCMALAIIFMPVVLSANKVRAEQSGDFLYDYAGDTATIVGYTGKGGNVVVPKMLDGYFVEAIGSKAFSYCLSLRNITLPESLTQIGDFAFNNCSNLERIEIPDSVILIGHHAFIGCESLKEAIIPDSVVRIDKWAFGLCKGLTSIAIPDSMDMIMDNAFSGCESLRSAVIPNGVRSIGVRAFERCISLENVMIPGSVESIGSQAFLACRRLAAAYFYGPAPETGASAFSNCAANFTIYYLKGQAGFSNPWNGWPAAVFAMVSHTVTFLDWDGTFLCSQTVLNEGAAVPPKSPSRKGYRFSGWLPPTHHVTENMTVIAQYIEEAPVITPEPDGQPNEGRQGETSPETRDFVRSLASSAVLLAMTVITGLFISCIRPNNHKRNQPVERTG